MNMFHHILPLACKM